MTVTFTPATRTNSSSVEPWVYEARLLRRSEVDERGCWIWLGPSNPAGYGSTIRAWHKGWLPHRLAFTVMVRPIPDGMQIDHLCRTRKCINPAHLEAVTQLENLRRQGSAVTHCPRGHEYSTANTRMTKPGSSRWRGGRACIQCDRASSRRQHEMKKALR
jgi:hypothetical protein